MVNLDESGINLHWEANKGFVASDFFHSQEHLRPVVEQSLGRSEKKWSITLVALICDLPVAQRRLPQFMIIPENLLTIQEAQDLRNRLPRQVYMIVRPSKWITQDVLTTIFRMLIVELDEFLPHYQPVLIMDGCTVHISHSVLEGAANVDLWLLLIPAGMTWLLQPLDTHAFRRLKAQLRQRLRNVSFDLWHRLVPRIDCYQVVLDSVVELFVDTTWAEAFLHNGLAPTLDTLCPRILKELRIVSPPICPQRRINIDELTLCLPARRRVPERLLLEKPFGANIYNDPEPPALPQPRPAAPRVVRHPLRSRRPPRPAPAAAAHPPMVPPAPPESPELVDLSDDNSSLHSHGVHYAPGLTWT